MMRRERQCEGGEALPAFWMALSDNEIEAESQRLCQRAAHLWQ